MKKISYILLTFLAFCIVVSGITQLRIDVERLADQGPVTKTEIKYKDLNEEFSEERLIEEINKMNFQRPSIILAQAKLETGHFKSKLFKENHNLFGMKKPWSRATTALGEKNGHAYYHNWRDSLIDYALYQSRYVKAGITETEYLTQLNDTYATDPSYHVKLKRIIEREQLKQYFP